MTQRRAGMRVDWLVVAEHLRAVHGVHGTVADRTADESHGALTFRAPGYSADCLIDIQHGTYRLTVSYQGAVGVLNDLHRGRDAGSAWAWVASRVSLRWAVGAALVVMLAVLGA